jgi:glucokinase
VADVGGTNARFAVIEAPGAKPSEAVRLPSDAHEDFAATAGWAIRQGGWPRPRSFLLAAAGPVAGRATELTNAATLSGRLGIDGPKIAAGLGLEDGLLLNDFEALSIAMPVLGDAHSRRIGGGGAEADQPCAVVGPGTGLGVAALLPSAGRLLPVASEAGHISLGPETEAEAAFWPFLMLPHVSAEELISGRGLVHVYAALMRSRRRYPALGFPADVTRGALFGEDADARDAVDAFLGLLGRFAGDMALAFRARGGVFVAGGVAAKLAPLFEQSPFRARFESKGRYAAYAAGIPTRLIVSEEAALQGLALLAAEPGLFAIDYAGRSWTGPGA